MKSAVSARFRPAMSIEAGLMSLPEFQRFQYAFTAHIRNPAENPLPYGIEARRMEIYRKLVYSNVENFLLACFPVLNKVLGKRRWEWLVYRFLSRHRSHSPYFHRIPEEFIQFLQGAEALPARYPEFAVELAHYEWVELALQISDEPLPPHDLEGLRFVRDRSPLPIIADESCLVATDVAKLAGVDITFARTLESFGVHVAYGLGGLKTHTKTTLVVRREGDGIRRYAHIGSGNYNSKTARIYTDIGLFTCNPSIGADLSDLFNALLGSFGLFTVGGSDGDGAIFLHAKAVFTGSSTTCARAWRSVTPLSKAK